MRAGYFAEYRAKNREKLRLAAAKWRDENKEREQQQTAAYRERHKAKLLVRGREMYRKHREKRLALSAKYKKANRAAYRIYHQNRKQRGAGKLSPWIVSLLLAERGGECVYCKADLANGYHLDHVMPLALGGKNVDENVQLLCPPCNLSKNAKHPHAFKEQFACA